MLKQVILAKKVSEWYMNLHKEMKCVWNGTNKWLSRKQQHLSVYSIFEEYTILCIWRINIYNIYIIIYMKNKM